MAARFLRRAGAVVAPGWRHWERVPGRALRHPARRRCCGPERVLLSAVPAWPPSTVARLVSTSPATPVLASAPEPSPSPAAAESLNTPRDRAFLRFTRAEAVDAVASLGYPKRVGGIVWDAVHRRGASSADGITSLSKADRARLAEQFDLGAAEIVVDKSAVSVDGTRKWVVRLRDGEEVEMVFIPDVDARDVHAQTDGVDHDGGHKGIGDGDAAVWPRRRGTLCVSSQVGCSLSCTFCFTGTQKLKRNLTAAEIVAQLQLARAALGEYPLREGGAFGCGAPSVPRPKIRRSGDRSSGYAARKRLGSGEHDGSAAHAVQWRVSNVVFMGQGEPMYAWRAVRQAIRVLTDGDAPVALSKSRITVSTSGVAPLVAKFARETDVGLAISLHAAFDSKRSSIMAINDTYPLPVLMDAVRKYAEAEMPGASVHTAGASADDAQVGTSAGSRRSRRKQGRGRGAGSSGAGTTRAGVQRPRRRVTFEYVMLDGVNDTPEDAAALAALVGSVPDSADCLVNLIPFNAWPGVRYVCSPAHVIDAFARRLVARGVRTTVRKSRGSDILAACGQLANLRP